MASLRRAPLLALSALLVSAPALAQEPSGSGSPQDGAWFPAEKKEAPRPPVDEVKPDEADAKPAPKPAPPARPASAPLPPPNAAVPPPYVPEKGAQGPGAKVRRRRPVGNVGIYLGGSGASGHLNANRSMRSEVDGAAIFGAELQFNLVPKFTLGGYLELGGVTRNGHCPSGVDECGDGIFRLGLSGHYHARPGKGVDPWFGVGAGITALGFSDKLYDGSRKNVTYVGFDLLNLQAGLDFRLGRVFSLGPYIAFNNGVYTGVATEARGDAGGRTRDSDRLASPTWHTWTTLGVRGRFNFF
ncbi:MAG TPA: hypothetical protein VFS43_29050 [Polyangiaceae bacterium]|nr:hypothetical protein [Polyangiaceae bacterium]